MARQQRTPGLRRTLGVRTTTEFATVALSFGSLAGAVVRCTLLSPGPWLTQLPIGWVVTGIPPIGEGTPGNLPIDAEFDGPDLKLTYAAPVASGSGLYIPPNMAQIRGPQGQYIGSQILLLATAGVTPEDSFLGGIGVTGLSVTLNVTSGPASLAIRGLPAMHNDTQGTDAVLVQTNGTAIDAAFAAPPLSGDTISWPGGAANWLNATTGSVAAGAATIP